MVKRVCHISILIFSLLYGSDPLHASTSPDYVTTHNLNLTDLVSGTTYYYVASSTNMYGYSGTSAESSFTASSTPSATPGTLQALSYTYDAIGNITNITDNSSTGVGKVIDFIYDDLYRLTSASTTMASSTPFSETYTYSSIGNITNKSDQGNYTYGETNYANPHAVTDINGTTLSYDNNGNLTAFGSDTYGWDYRNRLTSSTVGANLSLYGYDQDNMRVFI